MVQTFSPLKRRSQRHLTLDDDQKLLLYSLYKQASNGDAPRRAYAFSSLGLAKHKVWERMKHVPDQTLDDALDHIQKALDTVKVYATPTKSDQDSFFDAVEGSMAGNNPKAHRRFFQPPWRSNNNNNGPSNSQDENMSPEDFMLLAANDDDQETLRSILQFNHYSHSKAKTANNRSKYCGPFKGSPGKTDSSNETSDVSLDINYKDQNGQTALHIAADRGNLLVVELLLDYGANKDAVDNEGISVLQAAVIAGHLPVCSELLRRGANPDQPDQDGDTARLCAMDDGSILLQELFTKYDNDASSSNYPNVSKVEADADGDRFVEALVDQPSVITWNTDETSSKNKKRNNWFGFNLNKSRSSDDSTLGQTPSPGMAMVDRVPSAF